MRIDETFYGRVCSVEFKSFAPNALHTGMSRRMNSYYVIGEGPNSENWRNLHVGELMRIEICSS